jgi:ribosomal protein S18 acetylase RimI-like enzyme
VDLSLRIGQAADHLLRGEARAFVRRVAGLVYSDSLAIGIRKDLTKLPAVPPSSERAIRRASIGDVMAILDPGRGLASNADETWQRRLRLHLLDRVGVECCYVADAGDRGPSFMQYLFFAADNALIASRLPGHYRPVAPGEAFVEFLYVSPDARTMPFLTACMREVVLEARRHGVDSVFNYVRPQNASVLLACQAIGFRIDSVRRTRRRLFRTTYSYERRPTTMPEAPMELLRGRTASGRTGG